MRLISPRLTFDDSRSDFRRAYSLWRRLDRRRSLVLACSAEVTEGQGSRVRVALNGVRAVFHRPHPRKETEPTPSPLAGEGGAERFAPSGALQRGARRRRTPNPL